MEDGIEARVDVIVEMKDEATVEVEVGVDLGMGAGVSEVEAVGAEGADGPASPRGFCPEVV